MQNSSGALGLKAQTYTDCATGRDPDEEFISRIPTAGKYRDIAAALHALPEDDQGVLVVAHTPLPPALHDRAAIVDYVDRAGCSLASVCFWLARHCCTWEVKGDRRRLLDSSRVKALYERTTRTPIKAREEALERGLERVHGIALDGLLRTASPAQANDAAHQIRVVLLVARNVTISAVEHFRRQRTSPPVAERRSASTLDRILNAPPPPAARRPFGSAGMWATARGDLKARFAL